MDNAINRYNPNTDNLMFHSDQGLQYSSKAFIDYCGKNNITQSFANHYKVVQNVESDIYFYNYKRIHSEIGYMTLAQKIAELEKVA